MTRSPEKKTRWEAPGSTIDHREVSQHLPPQSRSQTWELRDRGIPNSGGDAHSALPDGQPQKVAHRNAPPLDTALAGLDSEEENRVKPEHRSRVVDGFNLSTRSDQAQGSAPRRVQREGVHQAKRLLAAGRRVDAVVVREAELTSPRRTSRRCSSINTQVVQNAPGGGRVLDRRDHLHLTMAPRTLEHVQSEATAHEDRPRQTPLPSGVIGTYEVTAERRSRPLRRR
jgi:hypothetical protein